jgi:hypothetical protein
LGRHPEPRQSLGSLGPASMPILQYGDCGVRICGQQRSLLACPIRWRHLLMQTCEYGPRAYKHTPSCLYHSGNPERTDNVYGTGREILVTKRLLTWSPIGNLDPANPSFGLGSHSHGHDRVRMQETISPSGVDPMMCPSLPGVLHSPRQSMRQSGFDITSTIPSPA